MTFSVIRILALACAISSSVAQPSRWDRTKPDTGALVVDASGKWEGSFRNISSAVAALKNDTAEQKIFIFGGVYEEQVHFPKRSGLLTVQGETKDARGYQNNLVTITGNLSRQNPALTTNDQTATVRLQQSDVKFYNLIISNTFGQSNRNGQALALSAQNTNQGFYACRFTGYQDTIYANSGRQIYAKSYINGAVDFIFGSRAIAWFEKCDIESIGPGYITANGRDSEENTSYYVLNECKVGGTSGPNSTVLGRPWRPFARTVFQKCELSDVVKPEGWRRWNDTAPIENVFYREFQNTGPGANVSARVDWAGQLDKAIAVEELLGQGFREESWVDVAYLA